jgi:hypothetical protein
MVQSNLEKFNENMTNHLSKYIIVGATALVGVLSYALYKYSTSSSTPPTKKTTPQKEPKPILREIYSNKEYGIEFEYPLGYQLDEEQTLNNTFTVTIKPDSGELDDFCNKKFISLGSSSYTICVEERPESVILKKYIEESIKNIQHDIKLVSKKILSKHKAELILDQKSAQDTRRFHNIMEVRDNVVYLISYSKLIDNKDDSYFNDLLKSFKILPVKKYGRD